MGGVGGWGGCGGGVTTTMSKMAQPLVMKGMNHRAYAPICASRGAPTRQAEARVRGAGGVREGARGVRLGMRGAGRTCAAARAHAARRAGTWGVGSVRRRDGGVGEGKGEGRERGAGGHAERFDARGGGYQRLSIKFDDRRLSIPGGN